MKTYESMIIVKPNLSEEAAKKENEKIQAFIKENGGEVLKVDEWGKRKLAYEIQKFTEGYYFVINYTFEPSQISQLERYYKLNEEVIRYNILAK
ncbi:MAG: 30S ribosomal protein S6 [Candidatus Cloacimonadota bacterium]|nr:MAG: 30S ribosomal protein S6 [Candidatus Cloacimonadota bacterium]